MNRVNLVVVQRMDQHTETEAPRGVAKFTRVLTGLADVFAFCRGLGLTPDRGRFDQYRRDIEHLLSLQLEDPEHFIERTGDAMKYRVALSESLDLIEVLPYLKSCDPGQLIPKLEKVLTGPLMPSDENAHSNVARNTQFELRFAYLLSRAGFSPRLGEYPDVWLDRPRTFLFECKRIFSPQKLEVRIEEADTKLRLYRKNHVASATGVVVVSVSRLLNPKANAIPIANTKLGKEALGKWVLAVEKAAERAYQKVFRSPNTVAVFSTSPPTSST